MTERMTQNDAPSTAARPVLALAEREGEAIWFLDTLITVKVRDANGADFGLVEYQMPRGSRTPFHRHEAEDEAMYVLEGELRVVLGDRAIVAGPGAYVHLPRGVAHGLEALTEARLLVLSRPDGFVEFAREFGTPAPQHELPPPAAPDFERLEALARKYRIELLGPLPDVAPPHAS
ncbi:MAG TPA: cupin domain-containing protein [Polyangiaceae bacterium]|nr:cupin domain-containing protein [Polyangiaceae bacterium]